MKSPKFSIIIPVYNVAPYLRECLVSVLAQTYTSWEAICVDDGSTDGSGAILDEYAAKDSRFRVIHQVNSGPSYTRNRGLEQARGEFVFFIDADDWIEENHLISFLDAGLVADVTFYPVCVELLNGNKKILLPKVTTGVVSGDAIDDAIKNICDGGLGDMFGWTWDKIWKRSVIESQKARFPEEIRFFEDEIFALRAFTGVESLRIMSGPCHHYRVNESGLTLSGVRKCNFFDVAMQFISAFSIVRRKMLKKLVIDRAVYFLYRHLQSHKFDRRAWSRLLAIRFYNRALFSKCGLKGRILNLIARLVVPLTEGADVYACI